jgi:glyoxylase-like metal-dependent hydrolase (beta-lactamase superfamily II)/8-oxo-dGTP pyrophosphatase MutT (NUDIX family)
VNPITEAASVLLARGQQALKAGRPASEVFVVRRAEKLRFFGGFHAFPGGKVSPEDAVLPTDPPAPPAGRAPLDVRRVTAVRELFEETGVLLARRADGSFPPAGPELEQLCRELLDNRVTFADVLARLGVSIRLADLVYAGSLVTPPFTTMRFDTAFFVVDLPSGQQASVWPGELDEGRWILPGKLLEEWRRGECLVSPPSLTILELLQDRSIHEAPARLAPLLERLAAGAIPPIPFAPGVQMIPLRTVALQPSTHTNAYLVGTGPVYLLDPGPDDADEQERLFAVLDGFPSGENRLTAIVLTHHHPDHVGAVAACARRYGLPIWAHPLTAQALADRFVVSKYLEDGDHLVLGISPDGSGPWHLEAVHTPGHAQGHLAFYEPHYRLLFAGDMVSTLSSIIIAPPDGDLAVYLQSLRRLQSYPSRLLLPAHGSVSSRPAQVLEEAVQHRAKREQQLLAALGAGMGTVAELVPELYKGLPESLTRMAELQTLAGLRKLQREGVVETVDEQVWRLRAGLPDR